MKKIIITILILMTIFAIVFFALSYNKKELQKTNIARIDLTTPLVNESVPQFEVYVDDSETPVKQAGWMPKNKSQGYAIQKNGEYIDITVKSLKNAQIKVFLRGPDKRNENNKIIENWVKYNSMTVNGNEILQEPVNVWHDKPFVYIIDAKKGDEYKIQIKWTKSHK